MQQTPAKTTAAPAESESGIKNADHEALRPHFELLIFALRNNIPARVVIDPVEVE